MQPPGRTWEADRFVPTFMNGLEFHQQQKFLLVPRKRGKMERFGNAGTEMICLEWCFGWFGREIAAFLERFQQLMFLSKIVS